MANTNINIRMDADLKRQFEAFCADMGMTMTTAFNVFARKAVREYRIPFEISGDVPNAETVEAIQEVKRMKADPSLGKTYSNVDQMMEELLAVEEDRMHGSKGYTVNEVATMMRNAIEETTRGKTE